jgi:hypothetical protein
MESLKNALPSLNGTRSFIMASESIKSEEDPSLLVDLFLDHMIANMGMCLSYLDGSLKERLEEVLHNPDQLPNQSSVKRAATLVDQLHQVQLRLDQRTVILADHFLGEKCFFRVSFETKS